MTELLARFSSRRPWIVIGVWVVLVVVALGLIQSLLPTATTTDFRLAGRYESERAAALLEERMRGPEKLAEIVIIQSPTLTVEDEAFRAKVETVHEDIVSLGTGTIAGGINGEPLYHYYQAIDAGPLIPQEQLARILPLMVSLDQQTVLMHYTLAGNSQEATSNVADVIHKVEEANAADDFLVLIGGDASVAHENNELAEEDLRKGEQFGVPVALLVLLLLFGAVVATLLPLGLAIVSIIIAMAAVAVIGQVNQLVFFVSMMVVMIGLAVGIDYSLLIVSRFKEEMGRGTPPREAVVITGRTAGRTVFFSGTTVVLALVGLLIVPASFYQSLALGAILVVIAALAATLTLLPAVLALLGPKVDLLSIRFLARFAIKTPEETEHGFWESITRAVTRFPVISILAIAIPMVAVTLFYFNVSFLGIDGINTGLNDVNTFPDKAETKKAFLVLKEKFSVGDVSPAGVLSPAEIVIDGDPSNPQVQEAIAGLTQSIVDSPTFPVPPLLEINEAGDLALLTLPFPGESSSREATGHLTTLREDLIPAAFDGVPAEVYVGGLTAETADFYGIVDFYTPIVFVFVLGLSFIILMMVFRSIVIPIKAIIMNLLSVGATYGLLVIVFQKGVGASLFGFQQAEVIDAWLPLFLFTILFGLSMDYHVFLLSRIRERYDETENNTEAVAYGLRSTAGIITGAALIMVVVFGAFAAGETVVNQLMGFGLAIAVFLDATLVRSVLVPASMEVLGKGNWYLPSWLRWLPDLRVEAPEEHPEQGSGGSENA
ncbi:MAG: MMPL family transporter [Chloroflexi bacterium]|nr:MMPL family transporter [Chloroflexota bacterium]